MDAVAVIEDLIKLGTIATDAAAKDTTGGKFDFTAFLNSDAPQAIQEAVGNILKALKPDELAQAVTSVEQKQQALLGSKSLADLSTDKLIQYSALTNAKLLLNTARLKRTAEGNDLYDWLVEGGLADIIKIAQVAIPLLV